MFDDQRASPLSFPQKILLVEDSEDDASLARRALQERGAIHVEHVKRTEQALDYLYCRGEYADRPDGEPALIVLDLGLPDGSGLDVLEHLRHDPAKRHIPVVVFTVSDAEADREASYAAGASVFVRKPVNYSDFMATMRAIGRFWQDLHDAPESQPE